MPSPSNRQGDATSHAKRPLLFRRDMMNSRSAQLPCEGDRRGIAPLNRCAGHRRIGELAATV